MPVTLFSSAARTATPTAKEFGAYQKRGLRIVIDVTAVTATPSVVPTIAFKDELSGKWVSLLVGNAVTAVGTTTLTVYPGVTAAANVAASDFIHERMRLAMVHGDADSITYTASAHLME